MGVEVLPILQSFDVCLVHLRLSQTFSLMRTSNTGHRNVVDEHITFYSRKKEYRMQSQERVDKHSKDQSGQQNGENVIEKFIRIKIGIVIIFSLRRSKRSHRSIHLIFHFGFHISSVIDKKQ